MRQTVNDNHSWL